MGAGEGHDDRPGLDEQVRSLVLADDVTGATTAALRALGPEVFGFIIGALGREHDADEVFAITSERLWRSLASFEWRCSLRTWAYVIARREITRYRESTRRHDLKRVPVSEIADVVAAVTTQAHTTHRSIERREKVSQLRDELPLDDRQLLILRVDRQLSWDEIALAFADDPAACGDDERKRESARLRKRFQLVKERLAARARVEGLL
jgi:RNA polymerase sigma-70 factor (ECF subfamily)